MDLVILVMGLVGLAVGPVKLGMDLVTFAVDPSPLVLDLVIFVMGAGGSGYGSSDFKYGSGACSYDSNARRAEDPGSTPGRGVWRWTPHFHGNLRLRGIPWRAPWPRRPTHFHARLTTSSIYRNQREGKLLRGHAPL